MLLPIGGKPLILHTLERAKAARLVSRVIVATDDERIREAVVASGNEAIMTSADHRSGSDRIAEVAETLPAGTIVVNVQGDEPLILAETIDCAVNAIMNGENGGDDPAEIVTTCEPLEDPAEVLDPNVVKVVVAENGDALYFSRSPMPFPREAVLRQGGDIEAVLCAEPELLGLFRKHTGLYVYRREFLLEFTRMPQTRLEKTEMLEQLRALENGARIKVINAAGRSIGVDTAKDLERVRSIIAAGEAVSYSSVNS